MPPEQSPSQDMQEGGWAKPFLRGALEHQAKIPVGEFGKGEAKSFDRIFKEVMEDDSQLIFNERGEVERHTNVLSLNVLYDDGEGNVFRLVEDHQVFTDKTTGEKRERKRKLPGSLSEKMKPGEDVVTAARRALSEELGITMKDMTVRDNGTEEETLESPSYPGMKTKYVMHRLSIVLPPEHFRSDGYTEREQDLEVYFKWVKQE